MRLDYLSGISNRFQSLSQSWRQVTYVLLTRSPLSIRRCFVRLACIRHAASVHPEPGSNSPFDLLIMFSLSRFLLFEIDVSYSVFKDRNFLSRPALSSDLNYNTIFSNLKSSIFFIFFWSFFWYLFCASFSRLALVYNTKTHSSRQHFFSTFIEIFWHLLLSINILINYCT